MRKFFKKFGTTKIATIIATVFVFGVLVAKIYQHQLLQSTFVDILTIFLLIALVLLSWILGWMSKNE